MTKREREVFQYISYAIVILLAVIMMFVGHYILNQGTWNSIVINLASEFVAVALLFYLFNTLSISNESEVYHENLEKLQRDLSAINLSLDSMRKAADEHLQLERAYISLESKLLQLEQRNLELVKQREVLKSGVSILRDDHLHDQGIAALATLAGNMTDYMDGFNEEVKKQIFITAIAIACADKSFHDKEQETIYELGRRYELPEKYVTQMVADAARRYPAKQIGE